MKKNLFFFNIKVPSPNKYWKFGSSTSNWPPAEIKLFLIFIIIYRVKIFNWLYMKIKLGSGKLLK